MRSGEGGARRGETCEAALNHCVVNIIIYGCGDVDEAHDLNQYCHNIIKRTLTANYVFMIA